MIAKQKIGIGAALILLLGILAVFFVWNGESGSYLNQSNTFKSPQTLRAGEEKNIEGLLVKVNSVSEDSRCPSGVVCIWEGRVVAEIVLSYDGKSKTGPLSLNETAPFEGYIVMLASVTPGKTQNGEIEQSDYQLTIRVEKAQEQK